MPTEPKNQNYLLNLVQGNADLPSMPLYWDQEDLVNMVLAILGLAAAIILMVKVAKQI